MTRRHAWIVAVGAAVLLLAGVLVTLEAVGARLPSAELGEQAPEFRAPLVPLQDTAGPPPIRTRADYAGDVILLNFWATWCEPCKVEMPSMEALHRDFAPHGLSVVAVSEDDARVSAADLRAYAEDLGLTFDILRDTAHTMTTPYQVVGYPTTFLIDRDGVVRRRWIGPEDWNSPASRAVIRDLLGLRRGGDTPGAR